MISQIVRLYLDRVLGVYSEKRSLCADNPAYLIRERLRAANKYRYFIYGHYALTVNNEKSYSRDVSPWW